MIAYDETDCYQILVDCECVDGIDVCENLFYTVGKIKLLQHSKHGDQNSQTFNLTKLIEFDYHITFKNISTKFLKEHFSLCLILRLPLSDNLECT
mgnify:CR=1 FL=1